MRATDAARVFDSDDVKTTTDGRFQTSYRKAIGEKPARSAWNNRLCQQSTHPIE